MTLPRRRFLLLLAALALCAGGARAANGDDPSDLPDVKPWPVESRFANPWPAEWEKAYQERARHVLAFWKGKRPYGGTFGENEKNYYPVAMLAVLTGDRKAGLRALQEDDIESADHAYTNGVDFYWDYSLKGQVRKYFYFADALDPAYRAKMKDGAARWLEIDPREPNSHPVYGAHRGPGVWEPAARGTRVDPRNADAFRAMRDVAIYLMAEETGNEALREKYDQALADYAQTLYHVGPSEWDSPAYWPQTFGAYLNLYDFAKDPGVKLRAKAVLDYLSASAALKYRRGGFAGPNCRDAAGGNGPFLAPAAEPLWLYFGDAPQPPRQPDRDDVYPITSGYRPPAAVVELARKRLGSQPAVEILATHPPYQNWEPGKPIEPRYWETQFLAPTYQLGTVVAEDTGGPWNVCAFKLLADNATRGVDYFVVNTESVVGHAAKHAGDQIGQYRNLAVWLRPAKPSKPFLFQLPRGATVEADCGITFVQLENTWLAIRPIQLEPFAEAKLEEVVDDRKSIDDDLKDNYANEQFLRAATTGDTYAGFALEVGDAGTHGSFAHFKRLVLTNSHLDLSKLAEGTVRLTGGDGHLLRLTHNAGSELPTVVRDGQPRRWEQERDVYRAVRAGTAPLRQEWMGGVLHVEAGGLTFEGRLDKDGTYTFTRP